MLLGQVCVYTNSLPLVMDIFATVKLILLLPVEGVEE